MDQDNFGSFNQGNINDIFNMFSSKFRNGGTGNRGSFLGFLKWLIIAYIVIGII